jgi:nucleoside-diphosphate-sugar epimerase
VEDYIKISIFGGGGFIGSHLSDYLIKENYIVTVIDKESQKISEYCFESKKFTFKNLDIHRDNTQTKEIIKNSDVVINLIAYAIPALYIKKPLEVVELNLFENLKIINYCLEFKKWIIQFSSCEVYGLLGGRNGIFSEESSLLILGPVKKNRWIYSCAKQLLERIIYAYGSKEQLNYTIIRPFNFIGPNMDFLVKSPDDGIPRVFANFMSSLLYKEPMYIVDKGKNRRTFTFIKDAVKAMGLILKNQGIFKNQIVNIGNPKNEISIRNLAYLMREIYKKNIPFEKVPEIISIAGDKYYGIEYQDSERRIPAIDKLKSVGWTPEFNLKDTFSFSMDYYIQKRLKQEL